MVSMSCCFPMLWQEIVPAGLHPEPALLDPPAPGGWIVTAVSDARFGAVVRWSAYPTADLACVTQVLAPSWSHPANSQAQFMTEHCKDGSGGGVGSWGSEYPTPRNLRFSMLNLCHFYRLVKRKTSLKTHTQESGQF